MNNTIYNIILQLIYNNKITLNEIEGNEKEVVEIVNKSQVEGLKEFVRTLNNKESGCLSNAQDFANDYIVAEIKKLAE